MTAYTILAAIAIPADRSPYHGSQWLKENIPASHTTRRITAIPFVAFKHTVVKEAISRNFSITVRKLTNCQQCHTEIENGSMGILELYIPGLTKANIIKEPEAFNEPAPPREAAPRAGPAPSKEPEPAK